MLLVAIHDVAPPHLETVRRLRDTLAGWGVDRVTLLAVPNYHGKAPLAACRETGRWLGERADAGDEVALHGFHHLERRPIPGVYDRARSTIFSAGEAEMLSLEPAEHERALLRGKGIVEQMIERPVRGFVAPAWLEPRGYRTLLRKFGFAWHETGLFIESLADRRRPPRWLSPALGFATRSRLREAASVAWVGGLARTVGCRSARPVRVAFHPPDSGSARVMACAERAVKRLLERHQTGLARDALG